MYAKQLAKRGGCKLQALIKGRNFGAKLTHLCGFWLDVLFFSHLKKHRSRLWLDFSFFLRVKNIVRSSDWLELICVWRFVIYFQWVCILVCIHCTGGTWHCIIKKDRCGISLHHYPTPQYFLYHSKKTGLDIWKRAIWKLQNKFQLRFCVINATINTLTEWLHRHKKILMLSSSVVCLLFYYQNSSLLFRHWYYNQMDAFFFALHVRVSQKFVPLISCAITFDQNFYHFYMKFQRDVYCSIEYMYSEC